MRVSLKCQRNERTITAKNENQDAIFFSQNCTSGRTETQDNNYTSTIDNESRFRSVAKRFNSLAIHTMSWRGRDFFPWLLFISSKPQQCTSLGDISKLLPQGLFIAQTRRWSYQRIQELFRSIVILTASKVMAAGYRSAYRAMVFRPFIR